MTYPKLSGWLAKRRPETRCADLRFTNVEKFVSAGKRKVRGIASSISVDRVGDIVVPKGGSWKLPLPLLWQHRHDEPIGWVRSLEVRGDVIWMEAEVADGVGKADQAWEMIEVGLVDSFSIGFLGKKWEALPDGGRKWTQWSLVEVSVVTVPANADAKISRSRKGNGVKLVSSGLVKVASGPGAVKLKTGGSHGGVALKTLSPGVKLKRADGAISLKSAATGSR